MWNGKGKLRAMQNLSSVVGPDRAVEQELVSVVIPTMNSATTLEQCLQSVKAQTHSFIETIVVDGGSNDSSVSLAYKFTSHVISGNFGRSRARFEGARQAQGRYLLFLDSDQVLDPDVIQQCVALARECGQEVIRIPEVDVGTGVWASCRALERQIAQSQGLSYPRFMSRDAYFEAGGHRSNLENYMEDRDLSLRLQQDHRRFGQISPRITNLVGKVSLLTLSIKGFHTAADAGAYYGYHKGRGTPDSLWRVIVPRIRGLVRASRLNGNPLVALALLFYIPIAYGPRFVRAIYGKWFLS